MNLWSEYVEMLYADSGASSEQKFVDMYGLGVNQSTIGRWRRGVKWPTSAAQVAEFARDVGRNPLEAFVAADMLAIDEAGRGLSEGERTMLGELIHNLAEESWAHYESHLEETRAVQKDVRETLTALADAAAERAEERADETRRAKTEAG